VLELNTSNEILKQNKIPTQKIEALTAQIPKFLQKIQVVHSFSNQAHSMKCGFYGDDHPNGHYSYQNNPPEE